MLAAACVSQLVPYIANSVHKVPNSPKLDPPGAVYVPPLRVYTFIPVTGHIVCRDMVEKAEDSGAGMQALGSSSSKPEDSKVKGTEPEMPAPKGEVEVAGDDDSEEKTSDADDAMDEVGAVQEVMAAVEKMEAGRKR